MTSARSFDVVVWGEIADAGLFSAGRPRHERFANPAAALVTGPPSSDMAPSRQLGRLERDPAIPRTTCGDAAYGPPGLLSTAPQQATQHLPLLFPGSAGATGFTGRLVAEHLARDYKTGVRWALAGRRWAGCQWRPVVCDRSFPWAPLPNGGRVQPWPALRVNSFCVPMRFSHHCRCGCSSTRIVHFTFGAAARPPAPGGMLRTASAAWMVPNPCDQLARLLFLVQPGPAGEAAAGAERAVRRGAARCAHPGGRHQRPGGGRACPRLGGLELGAGAAPGWRHVRASPCPLRTAAAAPDSRARCNLSGNERPIPAPLPPTCRRPAWTILQRRRASCSARRAPLRCWAPLWWTPRCAAAAITSTLLVRGAGPRACWPPAARCVVRRARRCLGCPAANSAGACAWTAPFVRSKLAVYE